MPYTNLGNGNTRYSNCNNDRFRTRLWFHMNKRRHVPIWFIFYILEFRVHLIKFMYGTILIISGNRRSIGYQNIFRFSLGISSHFSWLKYSVISSWRYCQLILHVISRDILIRQHFSDRVASYEQGATLT